MLMLCFIFAGVFVLQCVFVDVFLGVVVVECACMFFVVVVVVVIVVVVVSVVVVVDDDVVVVEQLLCLLVVFCVCFVLCGDGWPLIVVWRPGVCCP